MQTELGISDFHLREYLDAFAVISSNGRTPVGLDELRIVFKAIGVDEPSEEEFRTILQDLDIPFNNGELEQPEFVRFMEGAVLMHYTYSALHYAHSALH
jgi:Ca2+-binding EF-hand superfamily protein